MKCTINELNEVFIILNFQHSLGLHTLCAMVNKMPGVAYRALDQFHVTNRANRQQFFFLNYLEPDPDVDEASFLPMSVLGTVSWKHCGSTTFYKLLSFWLVG